MTSINPMQPCLPWSPGFCDQGTCGSYGGQGRHGRAVRTATELPRHLDSPCGHTAPPTVSGLSRVLGRPGGADAAYSTGTSSPAACFFPRVGAPRRHCYDTTQDCSRCCFGCQHNFRPPILRGGLGVGSRLGMGWRRRWSGRLEQLSAVLSRLHPTATAIPIMGMDIPILHTHMGMETTRTDIAILHTHTGMNTAAILMLLVIGTATVDPTAAWHDRIIGATHM